MPRCSVFLSNQFHWSRGVIANELLLLSPSKIALQADQRAIDGGWSLPLICLEIRTIAGKSWCGNRLWGKDMDPTIHMTLIPCDEMAHIAKIVTDGSRSKILLVEECLLIFC